MTVFFPQRQEFVLNELNDKGQIIKNYRLKPIMPFSIYCNYSDSTLFVKKKTFLICDKIQFIFYSTEILKSTTDI